MNEKLPVHYISWAAHRDIQQACTKQWSTPMWGIEQPVTHSNGIPVYKSDGGWHYTFDTRAVTCPDCLVLMRG